MITTEEAIEICRDRIVTGQFKPIEWAHLVLDEDELYFLLTEAHGYSIEDNEEFDVAFSKLEIELFGEEVSI